MPQLSELHKGTIIVLRKRGVSATEIMNQFRRKFNIKVTDRTIRRIWARHQKGRQRSKKERRGRKQKCSKAHKNIIKRIAENNRWASLRALTEIINDRFYGVGLRVNRETVRKILLKFGLKRHPAARKPILKLVLRQRRLDFARAHIKWPAIRWQSVVYSDEKIFRSANFRRTTLVTRTPYERLSPKCIVNSPKHPLQVHAWGAIGWSGVAPLIRVKGIFTAVEYQKQILMNLGNTGQTLAPRGRSWIFLQDNAPAHNANTTRTYLANRGIRLIDWPGNSPDLNPIEPLWEMAQRRLSKNLPRNVHQFWELVSHAWLSLPTWMVRRYIMSMPRRLQAVIDAEGGATRY